MLEKLLKNKAIKNAFLNQFRDLINKEKVKHIVVHVSETGEIDADMYKEDIKVLSMKDYNNIIETLKNSL